MATYTGMQFFRGHGVDYGLISATAKLFVILLQSSPPVQPAPVLPGRQGRAPPAPLPPTHPPANDNLYEATDGVRFSTLFP